MSSANSGVAMSRHLTNNSEVPDSEVWTAHGGLVLDKEWRTTVVICAAHVLETQLAMLKEYRLLRQKQYERQKFIIYLTSSYMTNYWEHCYIHTGRRWDASSRERFLSRMKSMTDDLTDIQYRQAYRLTRANVQSLCKLMDSTLTKSERAGFNRSSITLAHRVHLLLWRLGQAQTFNGMALMFQLSKSTVHDAVLQLLEIASERLPKLLIQPELRRHLHRQEESPGSQEDDAASDADDSAANPASAPDPSYTHSIRVLKSHPLPNAIFAVDGTHVPFYCSKDKETRDAYINRKGFSSLNVMGVVNSDEKFAYVQPGYAGGTHDNFIFSSSSFASMLPELCPSGEYVLGDNAYNDRRFETYIMTPPSNYAACTAAEARFAYLQSTARMIVERCFGQLKNRWRILLYPLYYHNTSKSRRRILVQRTVLVACCLHNFIKNCGSNDCSFLADRAFQPVDSTLQPALADMFSDMEGQYQSEIDKMVKEQASTKYLANLQQKKPKIIDITDEGTRSGPPLSRGAIKLNELVESFADLHLGNASSSPDSETSEASIPQKQAAAALNAQEGQGELSESNGPGHHSPRNSALSASANGDGDREPVSEASEDSDGESDDQSAKRRRVARFSFKRYLSTLPSGQPVFNLNKDELRGGGKTVTIALTNRIRSMMVQSKEQ